MGLDLLTTTYLGKESQIPSWPHRISRHCRKVQITTASPHVHWTKHPHLDPWDRRIIERACWQPTSMHYAKVWHYRHALSVITDTLLRVCRKTSVIMINYRRTFACLWYIPITDACGITTVCDPRHSSVISCNTDALGRLWKIQHTSVLMFL
jgi:hypothetical protein